MGLTSSDKENLEDVAASSLIAGMGLALLLRGFVPMIKGGGETIIYERNKVVLWAETIGVAAITTFGVYKFVKKVRGFEQS